VIVNRAPGRAEWRWRCSIFRNTSPRYLSSDLVREATTLTINYWSTHYGALPTCPLTTEVDPGKTRRKRDPGRCFRKAGWTYQGGSVTAATSDRGLVVLVAPPLPGTQLLDHAPRERLAAAGAPLKVQGEIVPMEPSEPPLDVAGDEQDGAGAGDAVPHTDGRRQAGGQSEQEIDRSER
jgi:hypothetical protein